MEYAKEIFNIKLVMSNYGVGLCHCDAISLFQCLPVIHSLTIIYILTYSTLF